MPPPNTPEDPDAQLAAAIAIENAARSANSDPQFLAQVSASPYILLPRPLSTRTRSPKIDFHALVYVDEIDDNLLCPICAVPFVEPVTTTPCDHTFCSACLKRSCKESSTCPVDREPIRFSRCIATSRLIRNQLDSLRVSCPNGLKGCTEIMRREAIAFHVQQKCPYTMVACSDPSCSEKVVRKNAFKDCQHTDVQCSYCARTLHLIDMESHLDSECPKNMIVCNECEVEISLSKMASHKEECLEAETTCTFSQYGCLHKTKRKMLSEHCGSCVYRALSVIGPVILDLQQQNKAQQEKIMNLERVAKVLARTTPGVSNKTDSEKSSVADLADMFAFGPAGDMPPDGPTFAVYNSLERQIEELSKNLTELETRQTVMVLNQVMPVKDQITEIRSTLGILKMHVAWLMNSRREELERSRMASRTAHATTPAVGTGAGAGAGAGGSGAGVAGGSGRSARGRVGSDTEAERPLSGPSRRPSDGSDAARL